MGHHRRSLVLTMVLRTACIPALRPFTIPTLLTCSLPLPLLTQALTRSPTPVVLPVDPPTLRGLSSSDTIPSLLRQAASCMVAHPAHLPNSRSSRSVPDRPTCHLGLAILMLDR